MKSDDSAADRTVGALALCKLGQTRDPRTVFAEKDHLDGLGLAPSEEIVGFLYLGSREGRAKPIPKLDTVDFVSTW